MYQTGVGTEQTLIIFSPSGSTQDFIHPCTHPDLYLGCSYIHLGCADHHLGNPIFHLGRAFLLVDSSGQLILGRPLLVGRCRAVFLDPGCFRGC
jgi:hypothetical protein